MDGVERKALCSKGRGSRRRIRQFPDPAQRLWEENGEKQITPSRERHQSILVNSRMYPGDLSYFIKW